MMAAIGVREEGVGGTVVDSGGERIYSMHEMLCTVADMGVLGHRGAEKCMYVHGMACMYGIYLRSKHPLPWSLLRCQPPSPRAGSRWLYGPHGLHSAMQYGHPTITDRQRQRQREKGQVRDTQRRMGMVQGQADRVR